jgi:tripartite-type tricarboxylate transporter receptor subunit TctC
MHDGFLPRLAGLLGAGAARRRYPAGPIRLVVGSGSGGPWDWVGQIIVDALAAQLGVAVTIDNRPGAVGAAGAAGAQHVASSASNGYTLLLGSSNELVRTGLVNPAQWYDPRKDFTPIAMVCSVPILLVTGPHVPAKTLDAFIHLIQGHPGKLFYGSVGAGSLTSFAVELIKQRAGLLLPHIPYPSPSFDALISDLIGGLLDLAGVLPAAAIPAIQSERITPLAVTSAARLPGLPQVPALGEYPLLAGCELSGWLALMGPRKLPVAIVRRLQTAMQAVLRDTAIRQRLSDIGVLPATGHEDLACQMHRDRVKYAELAELAGVRNP